MTISSLGILSQLVNFCTILVGTEWYWYTFDFNKPPSRQVDGILTLQLVNHFSCRYPTKPYQNWLIKWLVGWLVTWRTVGSCLVLPTLVDFGCPPFLGPATLHDLLKLLQLLQILPTAVGQAQMQRQQQGFVQSQGQRTCQSRSLRR